MEGRDPYDDFVKINEELKQYNLRLLERPMIVAANKMDMPGAEENLAKFKEKVGEIPVYPISAYTRQGIRELLFAIADILATAPEFPILTEEEKPQGVVYKYEEPKEEFTITRDPDGTFVVSGEKIERLFKMTNFNYDQSVQRFARQLRSLGVDEALESVGPGMEIQCEF